MLDSADGRSAAGAPKAPAAPSSSGRCNHCEHDLPEGCRHIYGHHKQCLLGPRQDPEWVIGMAIWAELSDRRGIKQELDHCSQEIQQEIIEAMGRAAVTAFAALA